MKDRPAGFRVVAPSIVGVGEEFSLGVCALCEPYFIEESSSACFTLLPQLVSQFNRSSRGTRFMDDVLPEWNGSIHIDGDGYCGPKDYSFADGSGPNQGDPRPIRRIGGMSFIEPGTRFISVSDPVSGVETVSNPIRVDLCPPALRLFWGDLHTHTYFTDAIRCPEEIYHFARDEAFLDICALSDHSEWITDSQWAYFMAVTNSFNSPGEFATLIGMEWTDMRFGHRNVYYPGGSGPLLRSTDPRYDSLNSLYAAAREHRALVIPHHPASADMGVDWSLGHDSDVERLVEIHSVWGTSERPAHQGNPRPIQTGAGEREGQHVVDALRIGRRFGFIGGGDIHDGRPGASLSSSQPTQGYKELHPQGIMGVWARELTREAIFEALWNRRVYATTGARILLDVTASGQPMGSSLRTCEEVPFRIEAAAASPIERVEIVSNGVNVQSSEPHLRSIEWKGHLTPPPESSSYYVRLTCEDGQMAWSSPVWVERG